MNHRADQLTPQEGQVVLALLSGSTNREVAAQLYVSVKTIETHLTRIYRKLGFRSRSQVIAAYYTGALSDLCPPSSAPVIGAGRPLVGSRPR